MKLEKVDEEHIRIIYEDPSEVRFIELINKEKQEMKITISTLKREIQILRDKLHTERTKNGKKNR